MAQQIEAPVKKESQETDTGAENNAPINNIDPVDLQKAWKKCAAKMNEKSAALSQILETYLPKKQESGAFKLIIDNKLQQEQIKTEKSAILEFLAAELGCSVTLKIEVERTGQAEGAAVQPMRLEDKVKLLMEKNPALQKLHETFNLQLQY